MCVYIDTYVYTNDIVYIVYTYVFIYKCVCILLERQNSIYWFTPRIAPAIRAEARNWECDPGLLPGSKDTTT